uniref:Myosin motor domain-containing protein n=1 Tax=Heligmosomoides polygyrus TaxID=6339 RepID=A0A183G480_HELPZ
LLEMSFCVNGLILKPFQRNKRAINPFLDSMGKRALNPFLDSIGKRAARYYYPQQKRYFDSLAGQSLGKRSLQLYDA